MSLALILAALLSPSPAPAAAAVLNATPSSAYRPVDRSLSDQGRLTELQIAVRSAYLKGEIDRATATEFYLGIERIRRRLIVMGIQVGYRQRVRVRERIEALEARLEASRIRAAADVRSGN
jgi:hypothetical protein